MSENDDLLREEIEKIVDGFAATLKKKLILTTTRMVNKSIKEVLNATSKRAREASVNLNNRGGIRGKRKSIKKSQTSDESSSDDDSSSD